MKKITRGCLLVALFCGALTGCFHDDDEDKESATSGTSSSTITAGNAEEVAAAAVASARLASSTGDPGGSAMAGVEIQARPAYRLAELALAQVTRLEQAPVGALPVGITRTDSYPCTGGGSMTLTVTRASLTSLASGDSIDTSFNNCVEGGSSAVNGRMTVNISALSGSQTSLPYSMTATVQFTALKYGADANNYSQMDGGMTLSRTETSSTETLNLSNSNLTLSGKVTGRSFEMRLSNVNTQASTNLSTGQTTISVDETFSATLPSGRSYSSIRVRTLQNIVVSSEEALLSGQVAVEGSVGKLRLTFSNNNVTIEIDANGDGSYESTLSRTVAQLDALTGWGAN